MFQDYQFTVSCFVMKEKDRTGFTGPEEADHLTLYAE